MQMYIPEKGALTPSNDIYPQIVSRIYQMSKYRFNFTIVGPIYIIYSIYAIQIYIYILQGPNLPWPNLPEDPQCTMGKFQWEV